MRRAFLLPVLLAAGLAGCGDSGNDLIPERTAARMVEQVDRLESAMSGSEPQCTQAREAAQAGRRRAAGLSSRVDEDLRQNLIDWFDHLEDEVRRECNRLEQQEDEENEEEEEEPTPTATPEATETATPTATATPEATPTQEPEGTPTAEPTPGNGGANFEDEGGE